MSEHVSQDDTRPGRKTGGDGPLYLLGGAVLTFVLLAAVRSGGEESVPLELGTNVVAVVGDTPSGLAEELCKDASKVDDATDWIRANNNLPIQPTQLVVMPKC